MVLLFFLSFFFSSYFFSAQLYAAVNEKEKKAVLVVVVVFDTTSPIRKYLGPMPIIALCGQDVSSHQGTHGKLVFVVRSIYGVVVVGGYEGWHVVSGGRRSGGLFHGEVGVGQGRGGEQLTTPRGRGRQEWRQGEARGRGGVHSRTDTAANEMADLVARHRSD